MSDPKKPTKEDATETASEAVENADQEKAAAKSTKAGRPTEEDNHGLGAGEVEDAVVVDEANAKFSEAADQPETSGEPEEPTQDKTPDPAPAEPATSDMKPLLAAGGVGAAIALLLAPIAVSVLPYGAGSSMRSAQEAGAERATTLTTLLEENEAAAVARVADLEGRIEEVNKALASLGAADQQALERIADERAAVSETIAAAAETARGAEIKVETLAAELEQSAIDQREELDVLRRQLANLAAQEPDPAPDAPAALGAPSGEGDGVGRGVLVRISLLEDAVRRMEARLNVISPSALPETRPDAKRLTEIETRLATLESRPQVTAGGEAALGVAFASLTQAIAGSAPYAVEATTLEKVAGLKLPEELSAPAAKGLPSKVVLAAEFPAASRSALRALADQRMVDQEESWTGRMAARLSSLIIIERTTHTDGLEPEAILSRAEVNIERGDVVGALAELEALPDAAKDGMSTWLARAEARAGAEAALAQLRADLLGAR
ncbi:MAG: hypothetical protein AAF661_17425 [Pseudomonadota bacterium]